MMYITKNRCKTLLWHFFFIMLMYFRSLSGKWCCLLMSFADVCEKSGACQSSLWSYFFLTSITQPKWLSQSEFIKGLTKTKSNGERIVNEYVGYGFPLVQRESTQEFSPFLRVLLGRYPSSQPHSIPRFLRVSPWQSLQSLLETLYIIHKS